MKHLFLIFFIFFIAACSTMPAVIGSKPNKGKYVHVVSKSANGSNGLTRDASVNAIHFSNGLSALPNTSVGDIEPIISMTDFYIRPGRYKITYSCAGLKYELPLVETVHFISNKNYTLRCDKGTTQLIIESAPNYAIKVTAE